MTDILLLMVVAAAFGGLLLLVRGCDRIVVGDDDTEADRTPATAGSAPRHEARR